MNLDYVCDLLDARRQRLDPERFCQPTPPKKLIYYYKTRTTSKLSHLSSWNHQKFCIFAWEITFNDKSIIKIVGDESSVDQLIDYQLTVSSRLITCACMKKIRQDSPVHLETASFATTFDFPEKQNVWFVMWRVLKVNYYVQY